MNAVFFDSKLDSPAISTSSVCVLQLLFIVIVVGTVALVSLLVWGDSLLPPTENHSTELLIEVARQYVSPEATERLIFMVVATIIPIATFLLVVTWEYRPNYLIGIKKAIGWRGVNILAPLTVVILMAAPFALSRDFIYTILGEYNDTPNRLAQTFRTVFLCGGMAIIWCIWETSTNIRRMTLHKQTTIGIVWLMLISCVLLQMLSWRLLGVSSVSLQFRWTDHADAAIFALSQVVAGKTLLVDLPSQYGLFPEILAPIFRLIGLSVLGLSSIFAVFQLVALGSLFFVFTKLVRIPLLRLMGGVALIVVTFGTALFFSGSNEPYFQYWPIRFFWPALSVLVFYLFLRNKTIFRSYLMSLLGGVGLVWNLDTGLFIVIAYGAFLVAKGMTRLLQGHQPEHININAWSPRQYATALVAHFGITVLVVLVFFAVLTLKAGEALHYSWLFEFQKIFYDTGFSMIPMPRKFDPWMSVLGVYLLGLLASIHSWMHNSVRSRMDMVFYLSMLGVGLFVYYQGRSHILNLVSVCWPAVMIAGLLTDQHLRSIRAKLLPKIQIVLPVTSVIFFLMCCFSFVMHVPLMLDSLSRNYATRGIMEAPIVEDELSFIKKYSAPNKECLIMAPLQGIYYAEAGLASPLRGPGQIEMILKSDQDKFFKQVLQGNVKCIFLGSTSSGIALYGQEKVIQEIRKKYSIIATNSLSTMQYLEPIPFL